METAAGLAMQSRAVGIGAGPGGRRDAVLGSCGEKWARTGTLRIGGPAGAATPAVAVWAHGDKPVALLGCLDIHRRMSGEDTSAAEQPKRAPRLNEKFLSSLSRRSVAAHPWQYGMILRSVLKLLLCSMLKKYANEIFPSDLTKKNHQDAKDSN